MNSLSLLLYSEIDILCILLLVYISVKSFRHVEKRESWHFFQASMIFIILFICSDLFWAWMENGILPKTLSLSYMINWFYFLFCMAAIAAWFFYTEYELESKLVKTKLFLFIVSVPLILMLIILVTNTYNHCLFYFDSDGVYQRGYFNVSAFWISCLYLSFCVIHALIKAFKKENYVKRTNYLNLAGFALPTTIPGILQIFISGTPLPCIGLTASVLMVYMNSQELLVSIDPLTKLNNRHQMVRYLNNKIEHYDGKNHLFLFLLDLDKFKHINDTYGHIEGDRALMQFSAVIKYTASSFNCFAARYGGDEFILIFETNDEKDPDKLCRFLKNHLEESNRISQKDYSLSVSIGYAEYNPDIRYVPEFISLADNSLYEAKKRRDY